MSKQLLAPGGLTAACAESVRVIIMRLLDPEAFQKLDISASRASEASNVLYLSSCLCNCGVKGLI